VLGEKFGQVTEAQFIFDANYHRRHLTDEQRLALCTVFVPLWRKEAQENLIAAPKQRASIKNRLSTTDNLQLPHPQGG
jgi:hypothetical protein